MLITVISQCHRGTLGDVRRLSLAPLNGLLIDIQHWLLNPHLPLNGQLIDIQHWLLNPHPPLNGLLVDIQHWFLNPHETRSLPQVGSWIQFTYRSTGNEYLIMPNSRALECELTSQSVKNHQPNHTPAGSLSDKAGPFKWSLRTCMYHHFNLKAEGQGICWGIFNNFSVNFRFAEFHELVPLPLIYRGWRISVLFQLCVVQHENQWK